MRIAQRATIESVNPYPRTWIEVDLTALKHNLGVIRERIGPEPKLGLVAKADAYGHGIITVGRYALQHGVDWIFVATIQEAISLRDAGVEAPIVVLSPVLPIEIEQAVFYRLRILVESMALVPALVEAASRQGTKAMVHIKVDTGISRFGASPVEVLDLAIQLKQIREIDLEGIATHFADSGADQERTIEQMRKFAAVREVCAANKINFKWVHAANSAGTLRYPRSHGNLVRVGIASYGIDPYGLFEVGEVRPLMTWKTRVMVVRERPAGTFVSYGSTHQLERTTRIATLGVGYGDGYPRALSSRGVVAVNGVRCPVIGLVCMDQMLVDVTDAGAVEMGDEVTLIGPEIGVPELAQLAGTNCHEITTRIMSRVPRRYHFS